MILVLAVAAKSSNIATASLIKLKKALKKVQGLFDVE